MFSESPWMYGMVMYDSGFSLSGGETGWVHWRETCLISVGGQWLMVKTLFRYEFSTFLFVGGDDTDRLLLIKEDTVDSFADLG